MTGLQSKITFVFVFIFISVGIIAVFNLYKNEELKSFLQQQTLEAESRYKAVSLYPEDTSDFIFSYLINTRNVINIFKYASEKSDFEKSLIRKRLHKHLLVTYKELRVYNIQQLHFHLPNNESFLRFHRPSKFGDNLSEYRKTVVYTNKNKVSVSGFEEGRIFNGYRFVYPLFDEKKEHIGSVEISHSVNSFKHTYQRSFTNMSLEVVIDKNIVEAMLFKDEFKNYTSSELNPNFMHLSSITLSEKVNHAIKSIKDRVDIKENMDSYKNFSVAIDHKKHKGIVSFIVIESPIDAKKVAYAISFQRSSYLAYFYEEKFIQMMTLLFVSFLITLVLYFSYIYQQSLKTKVYNDTLMNIYNRRFFEIYLTKSCKKQKRNNTELSLIMFDVDHFKNINDTHGHDIGDQALIALRDIVEENIRESDIFARWGGEEFMLLLDVDFKQAQGVAEKLRQVIAEDTNANEKIPAFTCSFGVISLKGIKSLDEACLLVDKKLYEAKETGRNKVVV